MRQPRCNVFQALGGAFQGVGGRAFGLFRPQMQGFLLVFAGSFGGNFAGQLIMFVGDQATLVMPEETLSLGAMTANDNFRIEPAFGPNGPTWRATKI